MMERSHPTLLNQVIERRHTVQAEVEQKAREAFDLQEAAKHIPQLAIDIRNLLGAPHPKTQTIEDIRAMDERMLEKAKNITGKVKSPSEDRQYSMYFDATPYRSQFLVPLDDGEPFNVSISLGSDRDDDWNPPKLGDGTIHVVISELGAILEIPENGKATVESIERKGLDRSSPWGRPVGDFMTPLGPEWIRPVTMQDVRDYTELLNRLKDGDVKREDASRPMTREEWNGSRQNIK